MWEIADMKAKGKAAFKGNYWPSVGAGLLLTILTMGTTVSSTNSTTDAASDAATQSIETEAAQLNESFNALSSGEQAGVIAIILGTVGLIIAVSLLLKIFVFNPLQVGSYRFFKKNVQEGSARFGIVMEGFGDYGHVFCTLFLRDLFIALWTCLFIIPGIIKSYSYMFVPYIVKDNPDLSANEVITRSKELMNGNKGRAFLLDLSFLGWTILGILTLNIVNVFWTTPYYENTKAALYLELTDQA